MAFKVKKAKDKGFLTPSEMKSYNANEKHLDEIWYRQQDEPIKIKDLGIEFSKKAKKEGYSDRIINFYLRNW